MTELRVHAGGTNAPTVLLLHGLAATADVWSGLAELLAAGDHAAPDQSGAGGAGGRVAAGHGSAARMTPDVPAFEGPAAWVAPDLPGHGRSAALAGYSFAGVAAAVAHLVDPRGTVVVGHSFGGVVGLHLAATPGVRAVIGLGIKVAWTAAELDRAAALARREPAVFPNREQAVARHLRLSGLDGLVDPADPALDAGVAEVDGGWRPAFDPRAFAVGDPQVAELLAAAPVPVVLARGEHDAMVSRAQLAALVPDPVDLAGLGHNAHVEKPAAVLPLIAARR